jgi:hypothetical protein
MLLHRRHQWRDHKDFTFAAVGMKLRLRVRRSLGWALLAARCYACRCESAPPLSGLLRIQHAEYPRYLIRRHAATMNAIPRA